MNTGNSFAAAGFSCLAALVFALPILVNADNDSQEHSPQATSASVYAEAIGGARFERSAIKIEQGYTIESGNLYTRDGDTGSLVVVRSPDGSVIARVDEPSGSGLLRVDAQGASTFTTAPANDSRQSDYIETQEPMGHDTTVSEEHRYIDLLMAYSAYALSRMSVDPVAFAFLQVEEVNLRLRNSLVADVSLRLAAVNVFDVPYSTSDEGLASWQTLLGPYRRMYRTDLNAAFGGWDGGNAGRAYRPGYTSTLGWTSSVSDTFAHELGHNAGGRHCWEQDGVNYNFGHDNGKTKTSLCYGTRAPYYSNPMLKDAHGLPLGNARTADMARVWRENTNRLVSYNPELPGLRMMLVSPSGASSQAMSELDIPLPTTLFEAGVVALNSSVGPVDLISLPTSTWTQLTVPLRNAGGNDVAVLLKAQRVRGVCETNMNVTNCASERAMSLRILYRPEDNPVRAGYYNGFLQLEARSPKVASWKIPINIAVSVRK
ncbi:reprolysin-like metallopeptidase [Pseudomonas sp. SMV71]|uniref:reprolysin-like metallopeptidase n=1 Tax=unclassified Pseudomonas TaxID=196821 RepID=UPI003F87E2A8